ncbi:hypothetical protein C9374_005563 [Naegleria lovaniensis]|uniref:Carboxypeptidase Taq n=1 Tax=Naegleria lovaniensis TaxID=51637 RepID=A0AA88GNC6_NAELO|nr:uncharacterized protein C9374_005563 [Naegleria lovaniensis]KAG2382361.1 hypothetical protein C9374_005563 [Naegleria lovaniensis]
MASSLRTVYTHLVDHVKKYKVLQSVSALLEWDELVMMPNNGADSRGQHKTVVASLAHDLQTNPVIEQYLSQLVEQDQQDSSTVKVKSCSESAFNEHEISNIILIHKEYQRNTKIPKELVERASELSSRGYHTWVKARKNSNWAEFAGVMQEWIDIRRQMSLLIAPSKNVCDTLLDEYDPGMTCEEVDRVFSYIKKELVPLIQAIRKKVQEQPEKYGDEALLSKVQSSNEGTFPIEKQAELAKLVAKDIGFNFEGGRLDVSVHPFSTSFSTDDLRITTRYDSKEFVNGLAGVIHETGHSLYEGGLNKAYAYQPVQAALGTTIHESQSLFWERHVGLSLPFWKKWYPVAEEMFPYLKEKNNSIDDVYRAVNVVTLNNFIRIESDELTYPMHVILRFEIEKALFDGSLKVEDVPKAWNQKFKEYLGLDVPSDSKGALQDVHWSSGAFFYFPTYLLGAAASAQISSSIPDFEKHIQENNYPFLKNWLNENIHERGSVTLNSNRLLEVATGQKLNAEIFINYLKNKYSKLYDL